MCVVVFGYPDISSNKLKIGLCNKIPKNVSPLLYFKEERVCPFHLKLIHGSQDMQWGIKSIMGNLEVKQISC